MLKVFFSLILVLGGIGSARPVRAQALNLSEVKALAFKLQHTSEFSEMECTPKLFNDSAKVFLFDGDLGFCPRYFIMEVPHASPSSPTQTMTQRLNQTSLDGENETYLKVIAASLYEEKVLKNCLLVKTVLNRMPPQRIKQNAELRYYSKRGESAASQCAQHLAEKASLAGAHLQIRVLAYSMGSEAALRFAERLVPRGITLEIILTVDPVGRNVNWTTGVITTEDNSLFKVPSNVESWINFFQKQDHYSLLHTQYAHLGIRGSRVIGANLNQEIGPADFVNDEDRKHGHVHILNQTRVLEAIAETLK